MSLSLDQLRVIHSAIVGDEDNPPSLVNGANLLLHTLGEVARLDREDHALELLRTFVRGLLEDEAYDLAAGLMWGEELFDMRPQMPKDVFRFLPKNSKNLLQGACSTTKSFSSVAWHLLDYLRDPKFTAVKLIAVNESHLKANMFAHMLGMFRACAVPMLDEDDLVIREADNYLGLRSSGNDMGIDGVAFRQSRFGSGTIRGYKPKPYRKQAHPKFGHMTRLRICGDEGQHWPAGQFSDLNSPLASAGDNDLVKVTISFNPVDMTLPIVQMAEPEQGWLEGELETLYEWKSRQGWYVLRLDAALCENVVQRKLLYPGFQTYEAYMDYMRAGDSSARYYVEARGFPPVKNAVNTVIPGSWVNGCWGEATFIGDVLFLASVDLAYAGDDNAIMGVFRWGQASGWRTRTGTYHVFKDRINPARDKPRMILQLDQLITLVKAADTITVADDIMARCKELGIKPEHVALDKTGMGAGTWSHLSRYWGNVFGITWGEKPSGTKIIADDREGSEKLCDNNVSEMWWSIRRWMDPTVVALIINPGVDQNPLTTELTYRRYWHLHAGKIRVESKEEYKARQKFSPDRADSLVMMPQLIRVRLGEFPGVTDQPKYAGEFGASVSHETLDEDDRLEMASGDYAERLD